MTQSKNDKLIDIYINEKHDNPVTLTLKSIIHNFRCFDTLFVCLLFLSLSFPYYSLLFIENVVIHPYFERDDILATRFPSHRIESY